MDGLNGTMDRGNLQPEESEGGEPVPAQEVQEPNEPEQPAATEMVASAVNPEVEIAVNVEADGT